MDNVATARTNLGLGAASTLVTGTANGNIPLIGALSANAGGANSAVVVRGGNNANGRFRVWSDGFIEQWATVGNGPGRLTTINFPIPYVQQASISITGSAESSRNDLAENIGFQQLTITNFVVERHTIGSSAVGIGDIPFWWHSVGF